MFCFYVLFLLNLNSVQQILNFWLELQTVCRSAEGENRPVHELTSFSVCVTNGFWPPLVAVCCDNRCSWFEPVSSWTGVLFSPKHWYRCLRAGMLPCFPSQAACLPSVSTWLSPDHEPMMFQDSSVWRLTLICGGDKLMRWRGPRAHSRDRLTGGYEAPTASKVLL